MTVDAGVWTWDIHNVYAQLAEMAFYFDITFTFCAADRTCEGRKVELAKQQKIVAQPLNYHITSQRQNYY